MEGGVTPISVKPGVRIRIAVVGAVHLNSCSPVVEKEYTVGFTCVSDMRVRVVGDPKFVSHALVGPTLWKRPRYRPQG